MLLRSAAFPLALAASTLSAACVPASTGEGESTSSASAVSVALTALDRSSLCVTEGTLTGDGSDLSVSRPRLRAVASFESPAVGEVRFTYTHPTTEVVLESGLAIRQVALKLRAQDACNLVYVRWIFDPPLGVSVEVKSNPGESDSRQCEGGGYAEVPGDSLALLPEVVQGSSHALHAESLGSKLDVWADGQLVWTGELPPVATSLRGPTGIRTDNVAIDFTLLAPVPAEAPPACSTSE